MTTDGIPPVTPLQFAYLNLLDKEPLSSNQMLVRLRRRGACSSKNAFFRVVQRLKRDELIQAVANGQNPFDRKGARISYELTEVGREAVIATRDFYDDAIGCDSEGSDLKEYELARAWSW